ncbi:MAG TPA: M56 family metallopeptidase [Gemmatimonadaceae bacterium]|nr:M56 family metallopeptidase [Gemmatimonadaceae bacterium]
MTANLIDTLGVLLDSALKGVLLVAAAAIAAYFLRNRSAAARHAAWTAAVVGHLALPAITLLAPEWRLPFLPTPPWLAPAAVQPVESQHTAVSPTPDVTTTPTVTPAAATPVASPSTTATPAKETTTSALSTTRFKLSRLSILASLWILGAIIVLLRLALGTVQVGRLARGGARVLDGAWLSLAQRVAAGLGITRPLTLLHGDRLGIPVTWGIVYPAVLLPPDANEWPEERRRFVLVHEMAHVKRFDALTQLAAQFAVALFWFDPLIWLAAHRMRVEREHACDDYVLRDGTKPSLYAGELLDMVRSLGGPSHERAAPAFAALAMARRSEFEGRMLAILDPHLDRHTLDRRSAMLAFAVVALLVLPLAALRPFEQPSIAKASAVTALPAPKSATAKLSCDSVTPEKGGSTSVHIGVHEDTDNGEFEMSYLVSGAGRCAEARMDGRARLSGDETRILAVAPGGLARFREVSGGIDRSVLLTPSADNRPTYIAKMNGRLVDFDATMQQWLATIIPEVMRESAIDAPQRVARLRRAGGVDAVLDMIAKIRSTSAKTTHYNALLDADNFTQSEIDRIARDAARDLASSPSDLRSVLDKMMPRRNTTRSSSGEAIPNSVERKSYPSSAAKDAIRQSVAAAIQATTSSGEKASLLKQYAAGGDSQAVLMALQGARDITSDGDKASLLTMLAAQSLSSGSRSLRRAYFDAANTITSDGDRRTVLTAAIPYGHANSLVTQEVIQGASLITSDGDKAEVLILVAKQRLLTRSSIREAFMAAAKTITSSGDYKRVLLAGFEQ